LGIANLEDIELVEVLNPSAAVDNLAIAHQNADIILNWSTPEFTGNFKVIRSADPGFFAYEEIATLSGNTYRDLGGVVSSEKYFYRVLKTW